MSKCLHKSLESIGLVDITDPEMDAIQVEKLYDAEHNIIDIHNAMLASGFKMLTHTTSGAEIPNYTAYESQKFKGGRATINHQNGKVKSVFIDYRYNNYD